MTLPARPSVPLWLRMYHRVPRRVLSVTASAYAFVGAALTPRTTARRRQALRAFASRVGWDTRRLDTRMRSTRVLMVLDSGRLNEVARGLAMPWLEVEGEEHLRDAAAAGRGVVVGFDHAGLYQILTWYLRRRGHMATIALPAQEPPRPRLGWAYRAAHAVRGTLWYQRRSILARPEIGTARAALEALRRGEVVMVATDGAVGKQTLCTMMGAMLPRATGPFRLAHATGAPLVVAVVIPEPDLGYRLRFHLPITVARDLPRDQAVAQAVQEAARIAEQEYLRAPWIARQQLVEAVARADRAGRVGAPVP